MSRIRRTALASTALLAAALTACSGGSGSGGGANGKAELKPKADMAVSVNLTGDQVKAGEPVTVTIAEGKLAQVKVTDAKGAELPGKISDDGRTWTSERNAAPGSEYKVEAQNTESQSAGTQFKTGAADKVNKVSINIPKGSTVGVAMPVSLVFDNPVTNKAAVEKQLKVTTSDNTEGSWGWIKDYSGNDRVDWRPKDYWKSGTDVKVEMNLNGVDSGKGGGMFARDYNTEFKIGKDRRIEVSLDGKKMSVTEDGQTQKTIPVSAGTPGGKKASWSGKMVIMTKEGTIRMDSQTVGLDDAYDKMVDYSMRLTWSGMYAHAAPWNAGNFGRANTSSGCVGMSDSDAKDFFAKSQIGDPFEVVGSGSKGNAELGNGYGEWNLSWDDWKAKSAVTGTAQNG
ncbi:MULTISPECIES: Ig-like domain-containing protein [unclassified Streptomyces]|uniref:L,D-transpeptidase n=1 Tax=unclassified Streptomyces TaxID=2593676 RepID=UPI00214B49E3|nr:MULTISPECIES: Ig-like domain-containing protein [unclassified Streptomyces]MCX5611280.1 Ig-like domain-containing protein [Streptomyces sp. NBC_00047]UUU39151.1 Ig-like domain-containing protein [Streptomyces sp. NBC_00162]